MHRSSVGLSYILPDGIGGGDDDIRADDTMRLQLCLRDRVRPRHPLAILHPNLAIERCRKATDTKKQCEPDGSFPGCQVI